jgi:hypothetical protein
MLAMQIQKMPFCQKQSKQTTIKVMLFVVYLLIYRADRGIGGDLKTPFVASELRVS